MSLNLDKTSWKRVTFGDVIDSVTDRVDNPSEAGVDRYVGLEHLDPGMMTVQRWDSPDKVEAQKLRFQPGDVIFGRRRAYQKKVALAEFEGICSAHALVLRARSGCVHPEFLPVFLSSDYFLDRAISISVGSLSPTINWRDLKIQDFYLPPVEEQKRIADLLWAFERHRFASGAMLESLRETQARLIHRRLASLPATARLGDLATTRSGPSYAASSVHSTPVTGSVPVIGIPNTKPDGSINLTDVGHVVGLPGSVGKIDDSSLVLIRTNGNRQRIGNVYLPPVQAHGYAISAFQFLMQVSNAADRDFIFWVLAESGMQERMSQEASGTVGLGNLAVTWLNDQKIPWSDDPTERQAVVDELRHLATVIDMTSTELAALVSLRSSLLIEIFGGN